MNNGLVLLSGGLDSAVTAWVADGECGKLYAMTFRYGQSHSKEVDCALQLGLKLGVERHKILDLPLDKIGGSALFDKREIPTSKGFVTEEEALTLAISRTRDTRKAFTEAAEQMEGIPPTWVPQRNSIFLAFAFAWAEVLGCNSVYIGVSMDDYNNYPDCRESFIVKMEEALLEASRQYVEEGKGIFIEAPLLNKSKAEIVKLGSELGVPFELTISCYKGEEEACGVCDSCRIRLRAFEEVGITDPIKYKGE